MPGQAAECINHIKRIVFFREKAATDRNKDNGGTDIYWEEYVFKGGKF